MPTAYTKALYEGKDVSFAGFAMTCARAMMPLISMKEEPMDAPVPEEITPDPWYARAEEEAALLLAEAEARTAAEWDALAASEHAEAIREAAAANQAAAGRAVRYQAMLRQAEAWQPPTPDHEPLKELMREELTRAAERDACGREVPPALSGADYRERVLDFARSDLERRRKASAGEAGRARSRTQWVQALRASLPGAAAATRQEG